MEVRQSPVIIIGMHRSGTSMLTRFIEESGVFMGHGRGVNDEPAYFQKINNWALFQANCTWDNPYNLQFVNEYLVDNLEIAIEKYLSSIFLKSYLGIGKTIKYRTVANIDFRWGWKDPRNTLLLPLWYRLFPNAQFVHIYRNPVDVAESLKARELRLEKEFRRNSRVRRIESLLHKTPIYYQSSRIHNIFEGIKLWEEYVSLALKANELTSNVIHIQYESFLQEPETVLRKLSNFLKIGYNKRHADSIIQKLDTSRSYAFLSSPELKKTYGNVKDSELIEKLGYNNLT